MIDVQALATALAPALVTAIENDPDLRRQLATLFSPGAPATKPEVKFMKLAAYARHIDASLRYVKGLRPKGLPVVGSGRGLRVDVAAADDWLRRRGAQPTIEELARANARRAPRPR